MTKSSKLRRTQLDRNFLALKAVGLLSTPKEGWIKEIRQALNMSMSDLAARVGVIKQRIERLEKAEVEGKVTIESMKNAAEAMDCEFVYFLRPRTSLESTYDQQAELAAQAIVKTVAQGMALESQATGKKAREELANELKRELLSKGDRRIWKTK